MVGQFWWSCHVLGGIWARSSDSKANRKMEQRTVACTRAGRCMRIPCIVGVFIPQVKADGTNSMINIALHVPYVQELDGCGE